MRAAILGFVGGAAYLQMQAALPAHPALALSAIACCGLVCAFVFPALVFRNFRQWRLAAAMRGIAGCISGAAAGFFWAALLAQAALEPQLDKADEGRDVVVIGTIASLPYRFPQGVRFNFAVERVLGAVAGAAQVEVPPKIALSWYASMRRQSGIVRTAEGEGRPDIDVQPGERWQFTVRLQRPHGNANPEGFDYEVWLLEQGVRATGYVRAAPTGALDANRRLESFVPSARNIVERCRALLRERILRSLEGREYAGVIVALVVGDQRGIERDDWQVFARTGISHLISISGLHITMIAGLFALLASGLWRRSFFTGLQLPLVLPAQKVAALAGAGVALAYVLLAGFGVPAQRTLYMLAVVVAALWCGRIASVSHVLCTALGLVVLLDPWAVLWPGFWLSFGAVATILYATAGRTVRRNDPALPPSAIRRYWALLRTAAHTQYVVTLGLAPLTLLMFSQVSLVSPLANAVAIPLVSLVVTPLALLGSLLPAPLCGWLLAGAHALIAQLAALLRWLGGTAFAAWSAPAPAWWVFCWALAGTLWLLAPRGWPHRWLGAVSWIPLLTALPTHPRQGQMWVTVFDVGQGMALLVETAGHRLLYDTGPSYSAESNGGDRVILPYLRARGIARLDAIVVSHSDSDHSGGALAVLDNVPAGELLSSLELEHAIVEAAALHGAQHRRCAAGQAWQWDGVGFEMLHPSGASYQNAALKPNARSCTLKITAGGKSILLAADIEAAQEAELVARAAPHLHADVLLAPHHGSGTSSTNAFLRAVDPRLALFQVGYRNRYQHPKAAVFERYAELGIARYRTDAAGAVTLRFGAEISVEPYRQQHPRYWYEQ
jgi:competence protein ComEC